tara:strand:+ start:5321 stop:5911 length:591 start_codon:yes stop_codon:yes gene_type:complete
MHSLEDTLSSIKFSIEERKDYFLTTSFGYQSALMFFLFDQLNIKPDVLYINNGLCLGDIKSHMIKIQDRFEFNLTCIDRQKYVEKFLKGRDLLSLPEKEKAEICRSSKREPLKDYIEKNNKKLWFSGIRRSQTNNRKDINLYNTSDIGVIKISPLAKFKDEEIKSFCQKFSLPMNLDYKDLCKENSLNECGLHLDQ